MSCGLTGRLFEYEVLSTCVTSWDGRSYVPFHQSLMIVKQNQPWNPTFPGTRAAEDLHCQVALALDLEDFSELSLFSAIGTPLDRFHGIDCLFEWKGTIVTIDLTTNPHKDSYKADFILRPEDEEDKWENAGKNIAYLLQHKQKSAYAS